MQESKPHTDAEERAELERLPHSDLVEMLIQAHQKTAKRRKGRPRGESQETIAKLERIAKFAPEGLKQPAIAARLKMDYQDLRKYLSRHRATFEEVKANLDR